MSEEGLAQIEDLFRRGEAGCFHVGVLIDEVRSLREKNARLLQAADDLRQAAFDGPRVWKGNTERCDETVHQWRARIERETRFIKELVDG